MKSSNSKHHKKSKKSRNGPLSNKEKTEFFLDFFKTFQITSNNNIRSITRSFKRNIAFFESFTFMSSCALSPKMATISYPLQSFQLNR
jgi:hypothetical protein